MDAEVYGNQKGIRSAALAVAATAARTAALCAAACCALTFAGCWGPASPPQKSAPSAAAVSAAIQSAESYMASQKPRQALQVATKLTEETPNEMRAHEIHARALVAVALDSTTPFRERVELLARAASAYDRAAALEPTHAALRHAAGVVNDTAERPDAALVHYRAAHTAEPTNAQYMLYLGVALARTEDLDGAQKLLSDAERLTPDSPDAKAALADLAVRRDDMPAAREYIAKALALDQTSVPLRLARARILRLGGDSVQALDILTALNLEDQTDPGVTQELALAHASLGRLHEAAVAYEISARAAPDDWLRALRCSRAWHTAGDPVKALVWLERAQSLGAPSEASDPHPAG